MKFGTEDQLNPLIKVRIKKAEISPENEVSPEHQVRPEPEVENKVEVENEVKLNQTKLNWAVTQLKSNLVYYYCDSLHFRTCPRPFPVQSTYCSW